MKPTNDLQPSEHAERGGHELSRTAVRGFCANPFGEVPPTAGQTGTIVEPSTTVNTPGTLSSEDWRPAVYMLVQHRVAAGALIVAFGGLRITRTVCGWTAFRDEHTRGGPNIWTHWPFCPGCA